MQPQIPAAISADATNESVSAIQPFTGRSVTTPLNDDVIVESSIDRNTATSTIELPPNNQTGSDDDVEIPLTMDNLENDGNRAKQNTITSTTEVSTQTNLVDI